MGHKCYAPFKWRQLSEYPYRGSGKKVELVKSQRKIQEK
jgi:hypothetical protein